MSKSITVIVPRTGISQGRRAMKVETAGFKGTSCQDATKFLANLGQIESDESTQEMFEPEEVERVHEGNG